MKKVLTIDYITFSLSGLLETVEKFKKEHKSYPEHINMTTDALFNYKYLTKNLYANHYSFLKIPIKEV